ncbi:MAG TPA: hypothetical protein ENF70_04950 [Deltaproteobacteria bacterium]|nr:hypothetical protein [Deltaproteobacteria bacterium]HDH98460.1 hypothetical protein [Deltaproteobacteria bacterium]
MPISIDYDRKENVIYTKAEGVIKLDDIISYFSSAATSDLKKGYRVLADYSDAILELSNEDIYEMARRRKVMLDTDKKISIAVFCKEDLVFGLGRIYEALLDEDKYNVMIFRSQEEARKWLGV